MPLKGTQGSAYPYRSNRAVTGGRRAIERDMSAVYHQSWGGPRQQPSNTPVTTAALNDITTTTAGPNATTINLPLNGTLVVAGQAILIPLYGPYTGSRNIVVTVTNGTAVVACSGVITGVDIYGRVMAEAWSVSAGGTSQTYTGKKAFKYVTGITATSGSNASTNSITVGDGVTFGLDVRAEGIAPLQEVVNGVAPTAGVITPYSLANSGYSTAFTADPRATYTPNAAPNGTNVYDMWFISDDPEFSDEGSLEV